MKFAEMTQEIQMSQPVVTKLDFGLTPGRRKANQVSLTCKLLRLHLDPTNCTAFTI
jgi:hypothetical protein